MRALTYGIALAALVTGVALPAATASQETVQYRTGRYSPATPVRLLDTRRGSPVGAGATVQIPLGERVPDDATAVVFTLTVLSPTTTTTVTPYAAGTSRAGVAVHVRSGESRAAQVTVGLAETASVVVHNSAGTAHVIADMVGYYRGGAGAGFHGVTPDRVAVLHGMDARETKTVHLSGDVPEDAVAAAVAITAHSSGHTHLTAWPTGATKPTIGGFPLAAGETRTTFATVALGADRAFHVFQHTGTVNAVVDIVGYYTATGGSAYRPRTPVREYDSRADYPSGLPGLPIPPRSRASFSLAGSVPADVTGVLLGVTGMAPSETTTLTVWADAQSPRPEVATLSVPTGRTVAGAAALGLRDGDLVTVYNSAGRTHVAVDLVGYFVPA